MSRSIDTRPYITDEMIAEMRKNMRRAKEVHQRFVDAGLTTETWEEAMTRIICGPRVIETPKP